MIQDFLSHGISIPIWPSNKVSKKTRQNENNPCKKKTLCYVFYLIDDIYCHKYCLFLELGECLELNVPTKCYTYIIIVRDKNSVDLIRSGNRQEVILTAHTTYTTLLF